MNKILESAKFVVDQSKFVHINLEGIHKFAAGFDHGDVAHWLHSAPFDFSILSDDEKLSFLLVFNSISFSYWGDPKWTVEYEGKKYDGAWGMIVCIKRAIKEGLPILDPSYRAKITREEFAHFLRGNTEIPLLNERYQITREVAGTIIEKCDSSFGNIVGGANKDARALIDLLVNLFSSFRDTSTYDNHEILFYKRAQLLVSDIYQLCSKEGYANLENIDEITACADYKLPQALRKFGILSYSQTLADKVDNRIEVIHDSKEEIEIRANTIWAVELIKQEVKKRLPNITSMDINDHIWLYTQIKRPDDKSYHLTRTTCY